MKAVNPARMGPLLALLVMPTVVACSAPNNLDTVSGIVQVKNGGGATCANCSHPDPAEVQFVSHGVVQRTVKTASNGRFTVRLRLGRYTIQTPALCDAARVRIRLTVGRDLHLRLLCFNATG